ncbi:MAG: hypothetical protein V7719_03430 [Psychroserpens sp.]|uniref:hypothetical protein n=1 Tax=Psychroserpens sp. TaxID=2020870 RepID=UPI0030010D06
MAFSKHTNRLIVLSYNISFQAMTHYSGGSAGALGRKCAYIGDTKLTICGQNMAHMIDGIPKAINASELDLVGCQEASHWYLLQVAAKNTLKKMGNVHSKSGRSEMASFYNDNRFSLTDEFKGEFKEDRPFHILILKEKNTDGGVIFINVHNPHGYTFDKLQKYLSNILKGLCLRDSEKKYRIVAVGDFNETGWDWNTDNMSQNEWAPFEDAEIDTQIAINNFVYSCCQADGEWSDGQEGVLKGSRGGDYIFDSKEPANTLIPPNYDASVLQSDHLPVLGLL